MQTRSIIIAGLSCLAVATALGGTGHAEDRPVHAWMTPEIIAEQTAAPDDATRESIANRRARLLLSEMSLPQKFQQLTGAKPEILPELPQCFGARHVSGIAELAIPTFRITNGPVGLGQNDCVSLEVADVQLQIPGFGGVSAAYTHPSSAKATALPSALGAAASFDPAIAGMYGEVIAAEMHNLGLHVFEAPGVNLARLPILGRNFEYFGEDPYLSGVMAVAETRAIQSQGLIAMPKHFAANEQETNRMKIQTSVDRQTLRELYLLPFEMAVKDGKAASVMCAYNFVNGQSSCESRELLTDILRDDWGFTGYVQSDFFAMKSTAATLANGMDHEMPLPLHWAPDKLDAALAIGELDVGQIDTALERRYTQAFKAGVFDRPLTQTAIDFAAGGAKAREIGARAAVLLQNNGALPFGPDTGSVVLIGKASQVYAQQAVAGGAVVGEPMGAGGGSSDVVPAYTVSPAEGLRTALAEWGNAAESVKLVLVDDANQTATIDGAAASFADALALAGRADAVVIMAGTIAEEGADRATFSDTSGKVLAAPAAAGNTLDWYAPRSNIIATISETNPARNSATTAMIDAILAFPSATGKPMHAKTALVLKDNAGVALPQRFVGPAGPAMVEVWFPGQEDGNIVADVLFGKVNPSGKLPVSMPFEGKGFLDQLASMQFPGVLREGDGQQAVTYSEKLAIGYRWYDTRPASQCPEIEGRNSCVAFPFGHGLSYTTFRQTAPSLTFDPVSGAWQARVTVTNSGQRAGAQIVQAYVTLPASADMVGHAQPPRRLVGFERVELAPGASGEAVIAIDPAASNHPLSVWDERDSKWVRPEGTVTVWLGSSSAPRDLAKAGTINQ